MESGGNCKETERLTYFKLYNKVEILFFQTGDQEKINLNKIWNIKQLLSYLIRTNILNFKLQTST